LSSRDLWRPKILLISRQCRKSSIQRVVIALHNASLRTSKVIGSDPLGQGTIRQQVSPRSQARMSMNYILGLAGSRNRHEPRACARRHLWPLMRSRKVQWTPNKVIHLPPRRPPCQRALGVSYRPRPPCQRTGRRRHWNRSSTLQVTTPTCIRWYYFAPIY
jgi:hypothetical protein